MYTRGAHSDHLARTHTSSYILVTYSKVFISCIIAAAEFRRSDQERVKRKKQTRKSTGERENGDEKDEKNTHTHTHTHRCAEGGRRSV